MQNESHNNKPGWRQKLEDFMPAEAFNNEAAWNNLYKKLHKPVKTKAMWYWIAAASLLIVLISFLFAGKKENVLVRQESAQRNYVIINSIPAEIQTQNKLKNSSLVIGNQTHFINKKLSKIISTKKHLPSLSIQNSDEAVIKTEVRNTSILPPDTLIALASKPDVIKHKLKVVHINELGEPTTDFGSIEKNREYASSALKFMNPQPYRLPASTVKTGIKIFSTN